MNFTVVTAAYNASATIDQTIRSVLGQSHAPIEVLVVDDGSTDDTFARLEAYRPRVTIFRTPNQGLSRSRNLLCAKARGELIAFIDADDVWHPDYLATQAKLFTANPQAVAGFTRYTAFQDEADISWPEPSRDPAEVTELLAPLEFFRRYNRSPVFFVPSCCCISNRIVAAMNHRPFPGVNQTAEDFYLFNVLPLHGPVFHCQTRLLGYRLTPNSMCADRLLNTARTLAALKLLAEGGYRAPPAEFARPFAQIYASRRRRYAKHLLGVARPAEARAQIKLALARPGGSFSLLNSIGLYCCSWLPKQFQFLWPGQFRDS